MYDIYVAIILLLTFIGGGAWLYLKVANTHTVNDGIQNAGNLMLLICFLIVALVIAVGFMGA